MGQTLSHGVYLPNEGERNCYAGLASNWQILNTAVGAIAEKAPLVHTHTVSQITDFPAYGNTAGTICEGNDSRLSDARTPVAHTHGKADITDLLNSNFIPSANNSYDLGSSSSQWNNLYAKKTYTSMLKAATGDLIIQSNGTNKSVAIYNGTLVGDGGGIWLYGKDHANGSKVRLQIYNTTTSGYEAVDLSDSSLYPAPNNLLNLGTSTNKWKTLNGVNPGALSLPNLDSTKYDPVDFSQWNVSLGFGNTYVPQSDGWLYANIKDSPNYSIFVFSSSNPQYAVSAYGNGSQGLDGRVALIMPVRAGVTYTILVKASSTSDIYAVFFMPALGNV